MIIKMIKGRAISEHKSKVILVFFGFLFCCFSQVGFHLLSSGILKYVTFVA